MKISIVRAGTLLVLGVLAAVSYATVSAASTNTPAPATPASLSYGVNEVLKLSQAQINDDIIVNYVQNSGTTYNLGAQDIVYLRNQGVSDRVVNAMLAQRQRLADAAAAQVAAQTAAAAPAQTVAPSPAPTYTQTAPVYTEPAPAYTEPAPAASTLYVIPYPAATAAYYGYYRPYPYYYGPYYGGYYGPTFSLGFRFGGGWGHFGGHRYYGGHHGFHR